MMINNVEDMLLLKKFYEYFQSFLNDIFGSYFCVWGIAGDDKVTSLNWFSIYSEVVFFVILLVSFIILLYKTKMLEKISKHIFLLSFIVWILGTVIYIIGFSNPSTNGFSVVLRAVVSSFKMFVVSNDLARVPQFLQNDASYMSCFALLHFFAAFITFVFIFKTIGYKIKSAFNLYKHAYTRASKGNIVHLFWGVNNASLRMAKSIRSTYSNETIIFIDIDKETEDSAQKKVTLSGIVNSITIKNTELYKLDDVKAMVDHCYDGPSELIKEKRNDIFQALNLKTIGKIVAKSSNCNFYFLSDDEEKNITGALNLLEDKIVRTKVGDNSFVYIHARKDANNEIFDHYSQYNGSSRQMPFKVIDSAYLSVQSLKYDERALPVNCVKPDPVTGLVDTPFTALIVGFGTTGQEAFKFLYEFSAFVDSNHKKSPFKCYAIDEKMGKIEGYIREKMPAIGKNELELVQTSVNSELFWNMINSIISDLNYVVINLNDDNLGISLAINIFKCALMKRPASHPMLKIMLRCYKNTSEERMSAVVGALNDSVDGANVEIGMFGTEEQIYTCSNVISEDILNEAKEFNRVYEKSDLSANQQWELNFGNVQIAKVMDKYKISRYHAIYDINRRAYQNIANALHATTKMTLMGFKTNEVSDERLKLFYGYVNSRDDYKTNYKKCGDKDHELLINIARVEHERWIASHKLMGFTYAADNCIEKKQHKYLCSWDELGENIKSYDCNVVDTTIKIRYK